MKRFASTLCFAHGCFLLALAACGGDEAVSGQPCPFFAPVEDAPSAEVCAVAVEVESDFWRAAGSSRQRHLSDEAAAEERPGRFVVTTSTGTPTLKAHWLSNAALERWAPQAAQTGTWPAAVRSHAQLHPGVETVVAFGEARLIDAGALGPVYAYRWVPEPGAPLAADQVACAVFEPSHDAVAASLPFTNVFFTPKAGQDTSECFLPALKVDLFRPEYELYNAGVSFGRVRLYNAQQFAQAEATFAFGWQDVLVLDEAPFDLTTVVSGVVTGTRQGQLSHVNIRSAARGTPNCFVRSPLARLAAWKDRLVRFACTDTGLEVREATPDEANAFWASFKKPPQDLPPYRAEPLPLVDLLALETTSPEQRAAAVSAYGAKGTNLATLNQRIAQEVTLPGFLVPISAYLEHVSRAAVSVRLASKTVKGTVATALPEVLADAEFKASAKRRNDVLTAFRRAIAQTPCSPALIEAVRAQILARGPAELMWRFRSSSNAEDILGFNGAGLYTSESGCLADEVDGDGQGPSRCDADKKREHTVCAALRTVWASVWNFRAFEERDFSGIPHERVGMGVLVNLRSKNERSNAVAFSGNPNNPADNRIFVDSQIGTLEVVAPEPGTWPESVRLTSAPQGTQIERVRRSSALPNGEVMSDAELTALVAAMQSVLAVFPRDAQASPGRSVIFDTEWKVLEDGRLIIKQIRPYLR
ncbi:MAG: PEP/pyruvate-binding domain-containing protein [Myxococcales bacterium]|nr:PEP/pyruvate-binding domain-containing protein [Myxococcales bacterium]